jgi:L-alanine-DL-glutamate epimerase-like enolase superfamily enzyme
MCARWRRETDRFPTVKLAAEVITLKTRHRFVIARGGDEDYRVVWVRLTDADGAEGWGEADPSRYYGETADTVLAVLQRLEPHLPPDPFDLEAAEARFAQAVPKNGAARAALSAALHDLVGKRLGQPLWRLWGLDPARAPRSSFTIGLDTPEQLRRKVAEASAYPILKIKLGTDRDEEILRTIRDLTDKPLRVDANAGWSRERAMQMLPVLKEYGVEFVEQPLAPDDLEGMAAVRRRGILPVVVDESCIVATDVARVAGAVDGINIKLAKCGSLREALRMIATARAHGMLVMVGCMIESSLGITAAAHLTPLADAADLDGAALTVNDPFVGATIDGGQIRLPGEPGLGVRRRE